MRIGIDIGGVIIDRVKNGQLDTSFRAKDYAGTPAVKGAFNGIQMLVQLFKPENVFLVSVVDGVNELKTNDWLEGYKFYEITGVLPNNLYNCRQRLEKAQIAKKLNLTHFIDDRPDVLEYMLGNVPNLYLLSLPGNEQISGNSRILTAQNWQELVALIKAIYVNNKDAQTAQRLAISR